MGIKVENFFGVVGFALLHSDNRRGILGGFAGGKTAAKACGGHIDPFCKIVGRIGGEGVGKYNQVGGGGGEVIGADSSCDEDLDASLGEVALFEHIEDDLFDLFQGMRQGKSDMFCRVF